MIISAKIEFLLYCLLDTLDLLTNPSAHLFGRRSGAPDLEWEGRKKSAYLVKRGLVESEIDAQRRRVYRLTRSGAICALGGRDPQAGWTMPWDGQWRLVIYDIPESDRKLRLRLRRELSRHGFGCLQKSVWISPHPAQTLKTKLKKLKIDVSVMAIMEARPDDSDPPARIVARAWNFGRLNLLYEEHQAHLKLAPKATSSPSYTRQWALQERSTWSEIIQYDPFLPDCLLPREYLGQKVWRRRLRVLQEVAPLIKQAIMGDSADQ